MKNNDKTKNRVTNYKSAKAGFQYNLDLKEINNFLHLFRHT